MTIIDTFSLIMRSNITVLCEKMNDPEKTLHQLIIDMEEDLDRARYRVAGAIADEIQLRNKVDQHRNQAQLWLERATQAVNCNQENQAKQALGQKLHAETQANNLTDEHRKQKDQVDQLQEGIHDLEDKIRQARQKHTLLLARLARAESQHSIHQVLGTTTGHSALAQFQRFEARVDRAEAMNQAFSRLDGDNPDTAALEREFKAQERDDQLNLELAQLKSRIDDVAQ